MTELITDINVGDILIRTYKNKTYVGLILKVMTAQYPKDIMWYDVKWCPPIEDFVFKTGFPRDDYIALSDIHLVQQAPNLLEGTITIQRKIK